MGHEIEGVFIVGQPNHFAVFGWAAKFYSKFLISLPARFPAIINDRSLTKANTGSISLVDPGGGGGELMIFSDGWAPL